MPIRRDRIALADFNIASLRLRTATRPLVCVCVCVCVLKSKDKHFSGRWSCLATSSVWRYLAVGTISDTMNVTLRGDRCSIPLFIIYPAWPSCPASCMFLPVFFSFFLLLHVVRDDGLLFLRQNGSRYPILEVCKFRLWQFSRSVDNIPYTVKINRLLLDTR